MHAMARMPPGAHAAGVGRDGEEQGASPRLTRGGGKNKKPRIGGAFSFSHPTWRSLGDSNPCFSLERATS